MAKVALLVEFTPCTRVVVDIPEGVSVEEWLSNDENFGELSTKARNQMLENGIEDYLYGDNMSWEEDTECPYGTLKEEE